MAYQINLENFEGPFDLLLFLIQKNQLDIYDIPITKIIGQYLQTIKKWQEMDLDIASEFIMMAARLMEIKSAMLLPVQQESAEEERDLKMQLLDELAEYRTFKAIGHYLRERETNAAGAVAKDPEYLPFFEEKQPIEIDPLILSGLVKKSLVLYRDDHAYKPIIGKIKKDAYRVEDKMTMIQDKLKSDDRLGFEFSDLLTTGMRQEVVVTFQALLECYKTGILYLNQTNLFGNISICSAKTM